MDNYTAGSQITIKNANIYPTFGSKIPSFKKSGLFFIYADGVRNNRIKITDKLEKVGAPCSSTGWIKVDDIILTTSNEDEQ